MRRCSSDWGFQPSVAATTKTQASTAPTPASMFLRKRTWPGTSMKETPRPDGRVVSGEAEVDGESPLLLLGEPVGVGAGEGPDQGRLAVVDVTGRGDDVGRHRGPVVVTGIAIIDRCGRQPRRRRRRRDRPCADRGRSASSRTRAMIGGACRPQRRPSGRRRAQTPADGISTPGRVPPPGTATVSTDGAHRRVASARSRSVSTGCGGHAPERAGPSPVASQVGQGDLLQGAEHQRAGPQRPGQRVAGAALRRGRPVRR